MSRRLPLIRRLAGHQRGAAMVEFALTGPMFLLLLMGIFDYSWQMYAKQVLHGAMNQAARAATLEDFSSDQTALDVMVSERVHTVFYNADLKFTRRAYDTFNQVGKPEAFTDKNGNNSYDRGECYEDSNGNNSWDAAAGRDGSGGADDIVLYTATMRFKRVLPVWVFLGQPQETTLSAATVLRNQPYNTGPTVTRVVCT